MKSARDFARFKAEGRKISMVTAYDAWSARLIARSQVDAILVGDSLAMVMHGHATTIPATVHLMALHTRAVATSIDGKFLIADLPFLSCRKGIPAAMGAVGALISGGAQAVKVEGLDGHEDVIQHIVGSGVPVMGHLGLTPQSVNQLGGFRVQGRNDTGRGEPHPSGAYPPGSGLLLDRPRVCTGGPGGPHDLQAAAPHDRYRGGGRH